MFGFEEGDELDIGSGVEDVDGVDVEVIDVGWVCEEFDVFVGDGCEVLCGEYIDVEYDGGIVVWIVDGGGGGLWVGGWCGGCLDDGFGIGGGSGFDGFDVLLCG